MKTKTIKKILAALLLLAVWQAAAMLMNQKILLASPLEVLERLFTLWKEPEFISSVAFSLVRIALGFIAGFFSAVILAVLAGRHEWIEILLSPVMVTIKSVPVASFIIIALVWLSGKSLSIFISFLMVLPVIYNNVLGGIKSIDRKMLEMADVFRIRWGNRYRYIWMPYLKPYVLSSITTALGMAWKAGIAAEVIGIPTGSIGERLYRAKAYLNTVDLFAWTVVIVIVSQLFEKIVTWLVRKAYDRYCR